MVNINRYTSTNSIASDAGKLADGRTTPTTVSSVICTETIAYTVTATITIGC